MFHAVWREAAIIARVLVEGVAERGDYVEIAAGSQHTGQFLHDAFGMLDVFENGVAFDALKLVGGEGQIFGICRKIYAGDGEEIEVDVALRGGAASPDVKVPAA